MKLLLIRHGESVGNAERRLQGHGDFPLTERGIAQARLLAKRLALDPPQALYSSPIRRAMVTAEVLEQELKLPILPLDDVREYDFGSASGLTWQEIREQFPEIVEALRSGSREYPVYPGEEGREVFRQRVSQALWGLAKHHSEGSIAVVTHAGPIAVFCLEVLRLPYRRPMPFAIDNCSITTIDIGADGRCTLSALNDTCHYNGLE